MTYSEGDVRRKKYDVSCHNLKGGLLSTAIASKSITLSLRTQDEVKYRGRESISELYVAEWESIEDGSPSCLASFFNSFLAFVLFTL